MTSVGNRSGHSCFSPIKACRPKLAMSAILLLAYWLLVVETVDTNIFPVDFPNYSVNNYTGTTIDLPSSEIIRFDWIWPFPNVASIDLNNNKLTEFPLLINVSATLVELQLHYNEISYVSAEQLEAIPNIVSIKMHFNHLSSLPELSSPLTSLVVFNFGDDLDTVPPLVSIAPNAQELRIQGITELSLENLLPLTHLQRVDVGESHLTTWPNFFFKRQDTVTLTVNHKSNTIAEFHCDEKLIWAKLAGTPTIGNITFQKDNICFTPSRLKDKNLAELTLEELVNRQSYLTRTYSRVNPDDIYVYLAVARVYQNVKTIECGDLCTKAGDCFFFSTDGGHCTLTNSEAGSMAEFRSYSHWYMPLF